MQGLEKQFMPTITASMLARRKSPHQQRVEAFMEKICEVSDQSPIPSTPTIPDDKIVLARAKIVLEEVLELLEAMGVAVETGGGDLVTTKSVQLYKLPYIDSLDHIAKELADVSVVTIGTFSAFGIADVPVLEEVDANNLGKFGPGGYLDANRKWRKPPNHPTPDIGQVLSAQGWTPPENTREES